jgi:hypothetical protein
MWANMLDFIVSSSCCSFLFRKQAGEVVGAIPLIIGGVYNVLLNTSKGWRHSAATNSVTVYGYGRNFSF